MARSAIDELMETDRPFGGLLGGLGFPWAYRWWPALTGRPFMPAVDIFERGADLVVKAELPGIDPAKDVTVTIEDGELTIKGERRQEKEVKEEGYYRKESSYGSFERHLPIPKGVTEADIKAEYEDGVLEVVVPGAAKGKEASKAKVIPVRTVKQVKAGS